MRHKDAWWNLKSQISLLKVLFFNFFYTLIGHVKKNRKEAQPKAWQWNGQDLQQSLELWSNLNQRGLKKSPEEQLLEDLRKLLKNLKKDIQAFDT
jgi:hypothetical protein